MSSTRTPNFYILPRNVVLRIFTFLPLSSLLTTQRISKRFRTLISRSDELRPYLFLEPPPSSPPKKNTPIFLHPVFQRLNFFAYHAAKAIRIGQGLDGIFLKNASVREQFATSPALRDLGVRVISGGKWPLDSKIDIKNENGVNVWDVIQGITRFFNQYEQISFGDHFGADICEQRGYDPKVLMQNHEFLDPDLPFPTIMFPDRNCNNVFIADYAFNNFAVLPLVTRPAEWYAEEKEKPKVPKTEAKNIEKAKNTEKATNIEKAPEEDKTEDPEHTEVKVTNQPCDTEVGAAEVLNAEETVKVDETPKVDESQDDIKDEMATPAETGSVGSKSMDIDNGSIHEDESKSMDIDNGSIHEDEGGPIGQKSSRDSDDGFTPISQAAALFSNLTLEEKEDNVNCKVSNISDKLAPSPKLTEVTPPVNGPVLEQTEPIPEEKAPPPIEEKQDEPALASTQVPVAALAEPISNEPIADTGAGINAPAPAMTASVPGDWDDAFA